MSRAAVILTLLALLAVQFLGAMAFASACQEPCPDDPEGTNCPPVCALCTSCMHAQQAIVQSNGPAVPLVTAPRLFESERLSSPSLLAADIFHVPLPG